MSLLIVSPLPPYPTRSGDALRIYNLARHLARKAEVDLICIYEGGDPAESTAHLKTFCRDVHFVPRSTPPAWLKPVLALWRFACGVPYKIKTGWAPESLRLVRRLTSREPYEAVIIASIECAPHLDSLAPGFGGRTILELQNVSFFQHLRIYQQAQSLVMKVRQFMNWFPFIHYEPRIAASVDATVCVSELDRQLLAAFRTLDNLWVVSNGIEVSTISPVIPPENSANILYLGSLSYTPNAEAAIRLAREIMPLVRSEIPDARLAIVGRTPPPEVLELSSLPGVEIHGNVPDIAPHLAEARVMALPLQAGGGTRFKILEAMAYGLPVVSSRIGCEGIEAVPGRDIIVADEPETFAAAVVELLRSPEKCAALSRNARQLVEERYDWDRVMAVYDDILAAPRRTGSKEGMR